MLLFKALNILLLTDLLLRSSFLVIQRQTLLPRTLQLRVFVWFSEVTQTKFNTFSLIGLHLLKGSYYVSLKMLFLLVKYFSFSLLLFTECGYSCGLFWTLSYLPNYLFNMVIRSKSKCHPTNAYFSGRGDLALHC